MNQFLTALVSKLPLRLQPYAKGIIPFGLAAIVVLQDLTISVEEVAELKTLAYGAVASLLVIAFPNLGYVQPGIVPPGEGYTGATYPGDRRVGAGKPE